jgi:hypothetical protein
MPDTDLTGAMMAYREKFGDAPSTIALPSRVHEAAVEQLRRAVAEDTPFADDAAWYAALGMEPPPDDADI